MKRTMPGILLAVFLLVGCMVAPLAEGPASGR